jgi:hypothetical protein
MEVKQCAIELFLYWRGSTTVIDLASNASIRLIGAV